MKGRYNENGNYLTGFVSTGSLPGVTQTSLQRKHGVMCFREDSHSNAEMDLLRPFFPVAQGMDENPLRYD